MHHPTPQKKVKIWGNCPIFFFFIYKRILYFNIDGRGAGEQVVCAWFHLTCWHVDMKIQVFVDGGDIWTSIRVHIIPFQITSLQSSLSVSKWRSPFSFLSPPFSLVTIYTNTIFNYLNWVHSVPLWIVNHFKLLATIWVFILFLQSLKYPVENGWYICFCSFFF